MIKKPLISVLTCRAGSASTIRNGNFYSFSGSLLLIAATIITFLPAMYNRSFDLIDDVSIIYSSISQTSIVNFLLEPHGRVISLRIIPATCYALFGTTAAGYYFFGFIFHIFNGFLLWKLAFILTQKRIAAFLAALIFLTNGLHWESIGDTVCSSEISYTFFYLLSLISFHKGLLKTGFLLFILSILSKQTALSLPVALLILFYRKNALKMPDFKTTAGVFIVFALCILYCAPFLVENIHANHSEGNQANYFRYNQVILPFTLYSGLLSYNSLINYCVPVIWLLSFTLILSEKNMLVFVKIISLYLLNLLPVIASTSGIIPYRFYYFPLLWVSVMQAMVFERIFVITGRKKILLTSMTLLILYTGYSSFRLEYKPDPSQLVFKKVCKLFSTEIGADFSPDKDIFVKLNNLDYRKYGTTSWKVEWGLRLFFNSKRIFVIDDKQNDLSDRKIIEIDVNT